MRPAPTGDPVLAADEWFLHHGLTYFVPEERAARARPCGRAGSCRSWWWSVLLASGAGGALAWAADQVSFAPATLLSLVLLAATWYALTALHARPIVGWALTRTFGSLRTLLPMTTRALPMLLLFITFLFINTEVWQVASNLSVGVLWLTVLLFVLLGIAFLLVRLPEEVDRTDDHVDERLLLDACRGTPLEGVCRELLEDPEADPAAYAEVTGFERWNLILVLVIIQSVQVLLLTVAVFGFLVLFGSLIMTETVMESWLERSGSRA